MKPEALLLSIRKLRMVEIDGMGAFAQIELLIARPSQGAKEKPRFDVASFTLFAPDTCQDPNKKDTKGGRCKRRWEAS